MIKDKCSNTFSRWYRQQGFAGLALVLISGHSLAGLSEFEGLFSTELEERAARANQATYNQLLETGCDDGQRNPTVACGGLTFLTWQSVRELVHTANELENLLNANTTTAGPTEFSLGSDLAGLGFALRWTAGEEFSAQGSLSESFVGGQLSGLSSRVSALRHGGSGFAFNEQAQPGVLIAAEHLAGQRGGGAGTEDQPAWSPWGSFLNVSYLYGDRDPTVRENAFDFDGIGLNGGIDYRINANNVVGLMLGYRQEQVDFDSSQSIVDGQIEMDGYSTQLFYLHQADRWYASASYGFQWMEFDTDRSIRYPSFNPDVESTNTVARSDTKASAHSGSVTLGYSLLAPGQVGLEPFMAIDYRQTTVDGYTENDINNEGFAFIVDDQDIDSLETGIGLKTHYVLAWSVGVFIPEITLQHRVQLEDDAREIRAYYLNTSEVLTDINAATFTLPTDNPDSSYQMYSFGVSAVLRGASAKDLQSSATGGASGYLRFTLFDNIEHYSQYQIAGGLRYEF